MANDKCQMIYDQLTDLWIGLAACINYFFAFPHGARLWLTASDV